MLFKDLFKYIPHLLPSSLDSQDMVSLQTSSKKVQRGDVFIAIKGHTVDGHSFVNKVLAKGAFVIKDIDNAHIADSQYSDRIIEVPNTQTIVAPLSKAFFGDPDESMMIIGVTGTNGKTTTTFMIEHLLRTVKKWTTGLIGTIHNRIGNTITNTKNTTPDAFTIYSLLHDMKSAKCQAVVMEISSHALELQRVGYLSLDIAIFTNISSEHLDFHKTMQNYAESKLRLFDILSKSSKKDKLAIFPWDSNYTEQILERIDSTIPHQSYELVSIPPQKDTLENRFSALVYETSIKSSQGLLYKGGYELGKFYLPFPGQFNISNFLGSFLCVQHFQLSLADCMESLRDLEIPGRFDNIAPSFYPFSIVVDYAHTPDALENILKSTKDLKPRRILLVFGCGGDRDVTKRPIMGRIAAELADEIFITSDNPRSEDPSKILEDIVRGIDHYDNHRMYQIINRREAISQAIQHIQSGDIMIIAGKGHEEYQILNNNIIPFSDKQTVLDILSEGSFTWK